MSASQDILRLQRVIQDLKSRLSDANTKLANEKKIATERCQRVDEQHKEILRLCEENALLLKAVEQLRTEAEAALESEPTAPEPEEPRTSPIQKWIEERYPEPEAEPEPETAEETAE